MTNQINFSSYCELTEFPFDTKIGSGTNVRIVAAFPALDIVVGYSWWGDSHNEAWSVSAHTWHGDGAFSHDGGRGVYPDMDLILPPGLSAGEIERLRGVIAGAEDRLSDFQSAPDEWRRIDEQKIISARAALARLTGDA